MRNKAESLFEDITGMQKFLSDKPADICAALEPGMKLTVVRIAKRLGPWLAAIVEQEEGPVQTTRRISQ